MSDMSRRGFLGRIGRFAGTGSIVGVLYAASHAPEGEEVSHAAAGAATGAVIGIGLAAATAPKAPIIRNPVEEENARQRWWERRRQIRERDYAREEERRRHDDHGRGPGL